MAIVSSRKAIHLKDIDRLNQRKTQVLEKVCGYFYFTIYSIFIQKAYYTSKAPLNMPTSKIPPFYSEHFHPVLSLFGDFAARRIKKSNKHRGEKISFYHSPTLYHRFLCWVVMRIWCYIKIRPLTVQCALPWPPNKLSHLASTYKYVN